VTTPAQLVQKLWNYCNILRDDGLSYGDYVEQLTFLLFLKMADEQSRPPYKKVSAVPKEYAWPSLLAKARGERRDARADLPEGPEQDPGSGQAAAADRGPDRQGELVEHGRRREGRRLRGPLAEECRGREGRRFAYDELVKRDKVNLDLFWLKDESLEESANLPAPDVIAAEIAEDLQTALEQFSTIAQDLAE
jgi:hypothetical protein